MRVADGPIAAALAQLSELPAAGIHALLGAGAFLESVIPPVPGDSFIGAGGLLAAAGAINPVVAFVLIWGMNLLGAVWVYRLGLRYGAKAFASPVGRLILDPGQLDRLSAFYERRGVLAIFFARFLPGLRAVVPAFAGVSGLSAWRVVPPLAVASLIWYGVIFGLGFWAGENVAVLDEFLRHANRLLLVLAMVVLVIVGWFWKRSRSGPNSRVASGADASPEGPEEAAGTGDPDDADDGPRSSRLPV